jgi:acetyltransferase
MAPQDLRFRLFSPVRELPAELAERLTQIDYDREMALVADDPDRPGPAAGRCEGEHGPRRAAGRVRGDRPHDAKGRGLGRIALGRVVEYARRRGVEEVWGEVMAENEAMLGLARSLGFTLRRDPDEPDAMLAVKRFDRSGRRPSRGDRTGIRGCDS